MLWNRSLMMKIALLQKESSSRKREHLVWWGRRNEKNSNIANNNLCMSGSVCAILLMMICDPVGSTSLEWKYRGSADIRLLFFGLVQPAGGNKFVSWRPTDNNSNSRKGGRKHGWRGRNGACGLVLYLSNSDGLCMQDLVEVQHIYSYLEISQRCSRSCDIEEHLFPHRVTFVTNYWSRIFHNN